MRARIVAGNWKMNTTREVARQLATAVVEGSKSINRAQVIVCPPFPYLGTVADVLVGSHVALGAQNCHEKEKGAYTGEVSPTMLVDVGCKYVILGHSERRHGLGEQDALIASKTRTALAAGLQVILCVGETLPERQAGKYEEIVQRQVQAGLAGLDAVQMKHVVLAYEPVWAIGTGQVATPEQAQQVHAFIRKQLVTQFGEAVAASCPILYGGSVTPDSARGLFSQADIDGGLIGGASLKSGDFLQIIQAAATTGG